MISVEEAKKLIESTISLTQKTTTISLSAGLGYTLAESVYAEINLPPFRQSAMDGYAINSNDLVQTNKLALQDTIQAGDLSIPLLEDKKTLRIFTGAPVPDNANAVIMQEKTVASSSVIEINDDNIKPLKNIREIGEQIKKGDLAIPAGTTLTPEIIGFATSLGQTEVTVYQKPQIALVVTGNELVDAGNALNFGQIYESNSITLKGAMTKTGYALHEIIRLKDDFEATKRQIDQATKENDVLVLSGGISVGDYDFVGKSLNELHAEQVFYKIKQKPGKPMYFGILNGCYVFALPGNPAAALTCYYEYVLPAIDQLTGKQNKGLQSVHLPLTNDFVNKNDRALFLKAKVTPNGVEIVNAQASSMLVSFIEANAFVYLPATTGDVQQGEIVEVHLL